MLCSKLRSIMKYHMVFLKPLGGNNFPIYQEKPWLINRTSRISGSGRCPFCCAILSQKSGVACCTPVGRPIA